MKGVSELWRRLIPGSVVAVADAKGTELTNGTKRYLPSMHEEAELVNVSENTKKKLKVASHGLT